MYYQPFFLLVLGSVIDIGSAILVLAPLLKPLATGFSIWRLSVKRSALEIPAGMKFFQPCGTQPCAALFQNGSSGTRHSDRKICSHNPISLSHQISHNGSSSNTVGKQLRAAYTQ